ncbi:MAG: DUF4070 domain-containing protein [Anaerolineaceae bacterium]|nr:DUF4070 domain-containing protein [Anaerolineaceae bacterium]
MKVLMVYPKFPDTFWSFQYALKFTGKKASTPPLGLITVAAMLPETWEIKLIDMNVQRLRNSDLEWADMVFISAMSVQRSAAENVIQRAKDHGVTVVAGGPLFTQEHESFAEVDHFVLNEAEITLPPFLVDLEAGNAKRVYQTDLFADMHLTPVPMWNLIDISKYDSLAIQFTRGCPFNCDFCNVTALLGHKVRAKNSQQILAELDMMYDLGWRRSIFFVDDNFIGNKKLIKQEILPAIIEWRKDKEGCGFLTEASINLADDEYLMDLMVAAGFHSVFVGIETPDEGSLEECNKIQNRNRNLMDSVKDLQRKGLEVMGGFIVGFDNDTESIFQRMEDFIQNSGIVTAMVGLLQAPLDTKLYARLEKENRITSLPSGDNVDGETNIVPVMEISKLKQGYRRLLDGLYQPKPFYQRVRTLLTELHLVKGNSKALEWSDIRAFFRSVVWLGLFGKEWKEYWSLIIWTMKNCPEKFAMAIRYTIYGYHFRRVLEEHVVAA